MGWQMYYFIWRFLNISVERGLPFRTVRSKLFAPPMRDFSSDVYARMTRKKIKILYYLITASNFLSFELLFVSFPSKQKICDDHHGLSLPTVVVAVNKGQKEMKLNCVEKWKNNSQISRHLQPPVALRGPPLD